MKEALDHNLSLIAERHSISITRARTLTAGLRPNATAHVYQYGQANTAAITTLPDQAIKHGQTSMTFPAYSITELVIPRSSCN